MTVTDLRTGPLAIKLLHHFEGCKLRAYKCPAGVWTIGYGDTGPHVTPGLVWTQDQAEAAFRARLAREFEPAVRECCTAETTPAQFGAMVALAYNIGTGPREWKPGRPKGFRQSSVARLHRAGDHAGAALAFLSWNRVAGKAVAGLTRRRSAEAALYRSDFDELARLTAGEVKA